MGELIDRDELKKHLMDMTRLRTNSEIGEPTCGLTRRTVFHMSEIMKVVIDMPTIEERKTGKWIHTDTQAGYDINGDLVWADMMKCETCGFEIDVIQGHIAQYNFCPNCGADMRGDDHEND